MKRLKVLIGHRACAVFMADLSGGGFAVATSEVRTPYSYSLTWCVWRHPTLGSILILETAHRRHEVYSTEGVTVYATEEEAEAAALAARKERTR